MPLRNAMADADYDRQLENAKRHLEEFAFPVDLIWSDTDARLPYDAEQRQYLVPLSGQDQGYAVQLSFSPISALGEVWMVLAHDVIDRSGNMEVRFDQTERVLFYNYMYYFEAEIAFTNLPVLVFDHAVPANAYYESGTMHYGEMQLINPNYLEDRSPKVERLTVGFRLRGNRSRWFPQPAYLMKLYDSPYLDAQKENRRLLGMRKDNRWVLTTTYGDPSWMRTSFPTAILKEIYRDVQYPHTTTDMRYVELFFNDVYRGLYLLREPIDRKQLDLPKTVTPGKGAALIKYAYQGPTVFATPDTAAFQSAEYADSEIKYPEGLENYAPYWEAYCKLITARDTAEKTGGVIGTVYDKENVVDTFLFETLVGDIDTQDTNFYVLIPDLASPQMIIVPWDYDISLGCVEKDVLRAQLETIGVKNPPLIHVAGGGELPYELMRGNLIYDPFYLTITLYRQNVDGFCDLVEARWAQWRTDWLTEDWLMEKIDELVAVLNVSDVEGRMNRIRYPNDFLASVDFVRHYMHMRLIYLDREFHFEEENRYEGYTRTGLDLSVATER
ncbi:MAG: CotH kinase family protein [Clostridia bacterium]